MKQILKPITICLGALVAICAVLTVYADHTANTLSSSIVRLHIIANSDSQKDQALKLKVRDRILEYIQEDLTESQNAAESMKTIENELPEIERIAREVLEEEGSGDIVKVSLGTSAFPKKTYGEITLPSGNYQSLKVEIGDSIGKNWWCVLFPPLCFVDTQSAVVTEEGKKVLEKELPKESYDLITSEQGDIKIKARFKIVDIIEGSKNKIQTAIASWFK